MKTGDIVHPVAIAKCPHVVGHVSYLVNQPGEAPVLLVEGLPAVNIVRLTNQKIYIWCCTCWREESRRSGWQGYS